MTFDDAFNKWWLAPGEPFSDEEEIAREAFLVGFIAACEAAYDAMLDVKGDKATRFDAQTAIRNLKDAATAIRGGGREG